SSVLERPKSVSDIPGPRLPRPVQSWLGGVRPVQSRVGWRKRYGPVFRTHDAIGGRVLHIADRELIEQMFKWKPGDYNDGKPRRRVRAKGPRAAQSLGSPHP